MLNEHLVCIFQKNDTYWNSLHVCVLATVYMVMLTHLQLVPLCVCDLHLDANLENTSLLLCSTMLKSFK